MYEEKMERICALLCLLSAIESAQDDPAPLNRRRVHAMLRAGALEGLVLRKVKGLSAQTFARAQKLLSRASAVFARVQAYHAQGYRILLEGDACWPSQLEKLGDDRPLYLFARGNLSLLEGKKAAVAGSREISGATREKAEAVGRCLARNGLVLVSGGAWGVDSAAAKAALSMGGGVIVVPAMSADDFFRYEKNCRDCEKGRLLLLCETPPDEPFSAEKALTRNRTIYALGDAAMVVAARSRIGGSWSGAYTCLKRSLSPLYILDEEGREFEGNAALIAMGARRMQILRDAEREELILQEPDEIFLDRLRERQSKPTLLRISVPIESIPRSELLRCLGWRGQTLDEQVLSQIEKAEQMALECIEPVAMIGEFELENVGVLSGTGFKPEGEAAALLLDGCQGAALMAVTLGAKSERLFLRVQATDKALAPVLDAALSAAVEAAADRVSEIISQRAGERGRQTTGRFSPGYGDMPMKQTGEMLDVLRSAERIGLTVSSSGLMMPRKSVCAIIGEGTNIKGNTKNGCAFCTRRDSCRDKGMCACAAEE